MSDPVLDIIDDSSTTTIGETTSVVLNILAIAEQGPEGPAGSVNQSAVDAYLSNAVSVAVSALHASVATELAARVAADDVLSLRITSVAGLAGVSATSQKVSAAIAVETSNRVSAGNALSVRINTVSNAASNAASVAQAAVDAVTDEVSNRIGGDDALSNAISAKTISSLIGVSIAGALDQQVLTYNSVDGKWHASTVAGGGGSVTSQKMSVAIAVEASNRISADNALSNALSANSVVLSNTKSAVQANSAQMTSADGALSVRIDNVSASLTSVASIASAAASAALAETSNRTSADNALSVRIDTVSNGLSANSVVLSNTKSAVVANSAAMVAADNALSVRIDTVSNGLSANSVLLSNTVSAVQANSGDVTSVKNVVSIMSAGLGGMQMKVVTNIQGISATALANVSGLSVSVAATAVYQVEGLVMYSMSVANTVGFGLTFPALCTTTGKFEGNISVGNTGLSATGAGAAYWDGAASGSIVYSVVPVTTSTMGVTINGVFQTSTNAGTIQVQARVSVTTSPVNIQRGSYIRAYKIL